MLNALLWNLLLTAGLAFALAALCRLPSLRRRPALRHWLWLLLLAKLVTPPLISVPLLPAVAGSDEAAAVATSAGTPTGHGDLAWDPRVQANPAVDNASVAQADHNVGGISDQELRRRAQAILLGSLLAVSLIGTCVILSVQGVHAAKFYRWLGRAGTENSVLAELCADVASNLAFRGVVRSCVVDTRTTPLVWGWRRPMVVVPRQLIDNLSQQQLRSIVAHELAHFVRCDQWANVFVFLVKGLLWWNPVVWWADRELRAAQELCCDAMAIDRCNADRRGYATTLLKALDFIQMEPLAPRALALGMGSRGSIVRRFEMIGETRLSYQLSRWTFLALLVLAIPLVCIPVRGQEQKPAVPATPAKTGEADDTKSENQATEPSLLGGWRADSVSIATDGGKVKTLTQQDGILIAIISEKTLKLRLGENVLAEMTYTLDTQAKPWTIDVQSKDGAMLGICVRRADDLQISLNDQAKGRPKDFDRNHNGMVLVLQRYSSYRISLINADGTGLRHIVSLPDFTRLGTPNWSRDGKKIAFDGWPSIFGPSYHDTHMFTVNADGSGLKDLGRGYMPSWSPDGKQLTYCQFGSAPGVWVMDADGSNPRLIDANGQGSQWSPNSNEIAYTLGTEICIRDMATGERRMLPVKDYRYIYWGFGWSPDGKWISFAAGTDNGRSELAAVSTDGKEFKVLMTAADLENGDLCFRNSWGGEGNQILFSLKKSGEGASRLYLLDFAGAKTPRLFPGLPADCSAFEPAWSPDGKQVAITFHSPPRPHEEIPTE